MALRVVNMVMGANIPLKKERLTLEDFSDIIKNSSFEWVATNEKYTCFLMTKIEHNKKKVCVSLWQSGWLQLMGGVLSRKEGERVYQYILKDLRQNSKVVEV